MEKTSIISLFNHTRYRVLIARALGVALLFGSTIVVARQLTPDEFGSFSILISITLLAAIPVSTGLPIFTVKTAANLKLLGRPKEYILFRFKSVIIFSAIGFVISSIVIYLITKFFDNSIYKGTLIVVFVSVNLYLIFKTGLSALQGLGRTAASAVLEQLARPACFVALVLIVSFASDLNKTYALTVYFISIGVVAAVCLFWERAIVGNWLASVPGSQTTESTYPIARLKAVIPLTVLSGMQLALSQIDVAMLGSLGTTDAAAHLRISSQFTTLFLIGSAASSQAYLNSFAAAIEQNDRERLVSDTRTMLLMNIAIFGILALGFVFLGRFFLALVFGQAYVPAYVLTLVSALFYFVVLSLGPTYNYLVMSDKSGLAVIAYSVALPVSILLNFLLIPQYGALGAVISTGIALTVCHAVMAICVIRSFGINCTITTFMPRVMSIGQ